MATATHGGELAPTLDVPTARDRSVSLLKVLQTAKLDVAPRCRSQRGFVRFLKRAARDERFMNHVEGVRDALVQLAVGDRENHGGVVLTIAGVNGGEGASTLSILLSLLLGSSSTRSVAYVDAQFQPQRFAALAELFGLSRGIEQFEAEWSELETHRARGQENVLFLRNPEAPKCLDFFSDREVGALLADLRQEFDFTVIDMPGVLKDASNFFLAPNVDGVYVVAQPGRTTVDDLNRSVSGVQQAGGEVKGVVLNQQRAPRWARLLWRDFFF